MGYDIDQNLKQKMLDRNNHLSVQKINRTPIVLGFPPPKSSPFHERDSHIYEP